MAKSRLFWNFFANRYARAKIDNPEAYERKLEITRQYLRPDMRVLEIGCGTGTTAIAHAPFVKHIEALDFSEKMLAHGRARAREAGVDNITFTCADADTLARPEDGFDAVLALNVLHLLDDRDKMIARLRDLLKPGGVFVSSTACVGGFHPALKAVLRMAGAIGLLPRVRFFRKTELEKSMADAGFEIVENWQPGPKSAVFIVARKPG